MTDVSAWISTADATKLIEKFINEGTYTKNELKKSSCKFANGKDKSEGYLCRVLAVAGKHPELEMVATAKRGRKATKPASEKKTTRKTKAVEVSNKMEFVDIIKTSDGVMKKLYSNSNDTKFDIVIDGKVVATFASATEAAIAFYGKDEAPKKFWSSAVAKRTA